MIVIFEGMIAGAAHVLSGPDHLAGVAPLAVGRKASLRPAMIGAWWGLGHGIAVAVLGFLGQTLLQVAQVEVASHWAERLVGLVLILIGAVAIRRARGVTVHEHVHAHGEGGEHVHLHVHDEGHSHGEPDRHDGEAPPHRHHHAALGVGLVHGFAGAGHFWVVLPSLAMGPSQAALYIGSYLVASVLIMMAFGAAIGRLVAAVGEKAVPKLMTVIGLASILIGCLWLLLTFGVL
jgi:ABC-type nickel/cobalt efflux system permease component RcnA